MKRSLCVLLVFAIGCAAPQRAGGERAAYLSMATASGGFVGALGGVVGCDLARYGLSHAPPGTDRVDYACLIGGTVVAGGAALYGSSQSDTEPDRAHWVVVSLGS